MSLAPSLKGYLLSTLSLLTFIVVLVGLWAFQLDRDLRSRIEGDWFLPPVEIYSTPSQLRTGQTLTIEQFSTQLSQMGLRKRAPHQKLLPGDFTRWDKYQCQAHLAEKLEEEVEGCVTFFLKEDSGDNSRLYLVAFTDGQKTGALYGGQPLQPLSTIELKPHLFAQFYGDKHVLRRVMQIEEIPLYCLQAVTAIEDSEFLSHRGVSATGLLRALIKNILKGRYAQGGSTITQQLVRVYFLTSQKTLKRKITEMAMALLLETRIEKDKILQNYLNAIYMGQNGPFQVVGFGAAAQHYFRQPLENLDLPQCALLAAIINSPGRLNPFSQQENVTKRRGKVLRRMFELDMITAKQLEKALATSLPTRPPRSLTEPAPYFVQAVKREIEKLGIDSSKGLRLYTTLDVTAQEAAQQSLVKQVNRLENTFKALVNKKKAGKNLQASLISVEVASGKILALVGGRSYGKTQYNRALDGHRQVGSIMKPFVYLSALETRTPEGENYTPLTPIEDAPLTHKYERQTWSPTNYSKKFMGTIPLMTGLKNSINAATARLGLNVGLDAVIDVAKRAGIVSQIKPLPSLTLGAFELFPLEVAQSYLTLARLGSYTPLSLLKQVKNLSGKTLYQTEPISEQRFAPENMAVLVGMMKQVVVAGTARSLAGHGFSYPAAGKTGTTNDFKDAWFAGFTPDILTVVWLGYDDNTSHGLTGSLGAIPIWVDYMKKVAPRWPRRDFDWPEGTVVFPYTVKEYNRHLTKAESLPVTEFELIFREGEQPSP